MAIRSGKGGGSDKSRVDASLRRCSSSTRTRSLLFSGKWEVPVNGTLWSQRRQTSFQV
ncbi:hypothetical protein RISK_003546 [Rhodopirellula islandica]|uniref:Uncharacterized protein n=1 Tax=Rhodopirellula islandica TaxID=595434 RepID=A0A0J1BD07_RHOIS|nr:hypothetical protein RISK_003546 [Rhodopirellula islandica]